MVVVDHKEPEEDSNDVADVAAEYECGVNGPDDVITRPVPLQRRRRLRRSASRVLARDVRMEMCNPSDSPANRAIAVKRLLRQCEGIEGLRNVDRNVVVNIALPLVFLPTSAEVLANEIRQVDAYFERIEAASAEMYSPGIMRVIRFLFGQPMAPLLRAEQC